MTIEYLRAYPSRTRRVVAPEGEVWVTICPDEGLVLASAGKAGTTARAAAQSIGMVASIAIRSGADPAKVALTLRGQSHDRSHGGQEAVSISDAIGLAIWEATA